VARGLKRDKHTRGWERITLRTIAAQIASEHGLALYYEVDRELRYQRVEQQAESDLTFLRRLCDEADLFLKIDGEQLIVYAASVMEARAAVFSISMGPALASYGFCSKALDVYRACEVVYHDPAKKSDLVYTFAPPDAPEVGQVLRVSQRVESLSAAMALAEKSLRRHNKFEVSGEIELPFGRTDCLAGINFTAAGFGEFDGKYFIDAARHVYGRDSGYTTSIEFHRVLEGY
jgi:phage protein D